ncbi:MOSC domain-containing protein [Corynebacterium incognita]|uniref:MOSC domain-containing protein n=1 Tax=Corynebacterium incognita TaxID=2754725 RepID=A0A7G7CLW8_9CORY|nr:MOSC domain-containing protein [Corynebacterium incognita]QNE88584.1 MOSC domain-containing protein [Corynebacterium incognita]
MTCLVVSTNVAFRRDDPSGRHAYTGIDKRPEAYLDVEKPLSDSASGVAGDSIGDHEHHGGADKAVYAFAREELDWWEERLHRELPSGHFGENLTTGGVVWKDVLINQRVRVGGALLEVSVPRSPCATFSGWMGEKGWVKTFTQRGDAGAYLRVREPGRIRRDAPLTFEPAPDHGVTMGMAFAAKMGDKAAAKKVVDAEVLPPAHHDKLVKLLH